MGRPLWWQRLFPTYGNWGGPGWSGGCWPEPGETDWSVSPVDSMDRCFKEHDSHYQRTGDIKVADGNLVDDLLYLRWDPRSWEEPAKGFFWTNLYRLGAIVIFWLKYLVD